MAQIGSIVDKKYEIVSKVGEGGMSVVWLAQDTRLNKLWAVKEIKKDANTDTHRVIVDSIRKEANIMKSLDHEAIARITDFIDDGDSLYVVMDYIQGENLQTIMKDGLRAITEDDVIDWGKQLCDALQYLHDRNIVYRDMKPGNVMLQDDGSEHGRVKIIDFGIAKEYKAEKQYDTMPLGTRGYASPEAFISNAPTTPRSDIYSLGVTLFHLATGHGPVEFGTLLPSAREVNPNVSPALDAIIAKATAEKPEDRYQSCNEFWVALERMDPPDIIVRYKRIWRTFLGFAIAGVACLAIGAGLMLGSNLALDSSYDGLIQRAAGASVVEVNGSASEAEQLYTDAIHLKPGSIDPYTRSQGAIEVKSPYNALVNDVYTRDSEFTTSEANRWDTLYRQVESDISSASAYGKLCYDIGFAYFFYYDYGDEMTAASRAVDWFNYAISDYESKNGRCDLTEQEYNTAQAYKTIGDFSTVLQRLTETGRESEAYADYWGALEEACDNLSEYDESGNRRTGLPDIFPQLRLYETVFQAINSQSYLSGFQRAGVSEREISALLEEVVSRAQALQSEATGEKTSKLCATILDGADDARNSIQMVFHNVASAGGGSSSTSSGGGSGASGASTSAERTSR